MKTVKQTNKQTIGEVCLQWRHGTEAQIIKNVSHMWMWGKTFQAEGIAQQSVYCEPRLSADRQEPKWLEAKWVRRRVRADKEGWAGTRPCKAF